MVSTIRLYTVPASQTDTPGYSVVGARQLARDLESKEPYVTVMEWGDTSVQEEYIGNGQSWSPTYGWGFSQMSLFLVPA